MTKENSNGVTDEQENLEPDQNEDESLDTDRAADTSLSVQDLVVLQNVINVVASRGAFRAEELEGVGRIYNKLTSFLNTLNNNSDVQEEK